MYVCIEKLEFVQYAFYFLVVGAAIWASSWAGEFYFQNIRLFFLGLVLL